MNTSEAAISYYLYVKDQAVNQLIPAHAIQTFVYKIN
jgi:sRNA-binding regulator protein Hfq